MIIEHIFYFIIPFSCQNLSSIHAFVLHTKGLQVDVDLYTRTRFFLSRFWEQIAQPLFNDPLSYATYFQNSLQWSLLTSLTVYIYTSEN
jgi:hypothetical protein